MRSRIRELREARGWSQSRVARELGIPEKTVGRWERGGLGEARAEGALALARLLGTSVEDLLGGREDER